EGFAFSHSTECREVFVLCANVPPFQFHVVRDNIFIFVVVQLV
ncbi:hypothetical protein CFOL_v3_35488, partial [Cephalotus follicularis]